MKQKIKIPDEIVKQVATELVDIFFLDWDKSLLKKCNVPSKKQLINEVIDEINNNSYLHETLYYSIEEIISDIFVSGTLGSYNNKLSVIERPK